MSGCATTGALSPVEGDDHAAASITRLFDQDTTLTGTHQVKGVWKVRNGATLTLAPGATLRFVPFDPDKDGVNDSALLVEGGFIARGEPDAPIRLTSAARKPEPGDWLEVRIEKAEGVVLQYVILEYARNGLHAHFCSGVIADSVFRRNLDATHFSVGRFDILRNAFEDNLGSGISFRDSSLAIDFNRFRGNRNGVFLFEKNSESRMGRNLFEGNSLADIRYGDFFQGEVNPRAFSVYPHSEKGQPVRIVLPDGQVFESPDTRPPDRWLGPVRSRGQLIPQWKKEVGSFLDASPVFAGTDRVAVVTWGGDLIKLDPANGAEVWRTRIGDVMEATPGRFPLQPPLLVVSAWDRKVRGVEEDTGRIAWEWEWPSSPQDDHHQASPFQGKGDQVILGLWNGEVVSLDAANGQVHWRTSLDGAIRFTAGEVGVDQLLVGTDAGTLFRLSMEGQVLGQEKLPGPVRGGLGFLPDWYLPITTWDGSLTVFTNDGDRLWSRKIAFQGTYAVPLLSDVTQVRRRAIIAGTGGGRVIALDAATGSILWEKDVRSPVHRLQDYIASSGLLVAGTENGEAILLDGRTGQELSVIRTGGAIHGMGVFLSWTRVPERPPVEFPHPNIFLVFGSRDGILRGANVSWKQEPWEAPP